MTIARYLTLTMTVVVPCPSPRDSGKAIIISITRMTNEATQALTIGRNSVMLIREDSTPRATMAVNLGDKGNRASAGDLYRWVTTYVTERCGLILDDADPTNVGRRVRDEILKALIEHGPQFADRDPSPVTADYTGA